MSLQPTGEASAPHEHSFPTTPPLGSMDQPGNCRSCGTTYEEAKQQMPAPASVVTSRSVSLNITGPDVPNRDGEGHIAPSRVDFTYRTSEVRAWLEGRWRRTDGVLTDAPASQPYTGDMADWPDWLADLARKHDPRGAAAVPAGQAPATDRWEPCSPEWLASMPDGACSWAPRTPGDGTTVSHFHPARRQASATDRAGLREQIAKALVRYDWNAGLSGRDTPSEHHYGEADAVLAVLPAPADRATVLEEAADVYARLLADMGADVDKDPRYWSGVQHVVTGLRSLAAAPAAVSAVPGQADNETQPAPLTPCTCRQSIHTSEHRTPIDGCPWCTKAPDIRSKSDALENKEPT